MPKYKTKRELTEREIEILHLISVGYMRKEVAAKLFLSEGSVKTYMTNIFRKLGVGTGPHAVAVAIGKGIVEAPT